MREILDALLAFLGLAPRMVARQVGGRVEVVELDGLGRTRAVHILDRQESPRA